MRRLLFISLLCLFMPAISQAQDWGRYGPPQGTDSMSVICREYDSSNVGRPVLERNKTQLFWTSLCSIPDLWYYGWTTGGMAADGSTM